jgi:hypothetical protein
MYDEGRIDDKYHKGYFISNTSELILCWNVKPSFGFFPYLANKYIDLEIVSLKKLNLAKEFEEYTSLMDKEFYIFSDFIKVKKRETINYVSGTFFVEMDKQSGVKDLESILAKNKNMNLHKLAKA